MTDRPFPRIRITAAQERAALQREIAASCDYGLNLTVGSITSGIEDKKLRALLRKLKDDPAFMRAAVKAMRPSVIVTPMKKGKPGSPTVFLHRPMR